MTRDDSTILDRLAEAITDQTPIDWQATRAAHPELTPRLLQLRLVEQIADVHRLPAADDAALIPSIDETPLFVWGHLHVLEKLGEGSFGAVYRAYDARLRCEVALKLLHEDLVEGSLSATRFLDEARRMARVRHPNVLVIHGADEHDGRPGFWTDLLDGDTLEERLDATAPLAAGEAAVIGIELCRALAAVHEAGLVHGDVKAANVMREARGHIVLMDFGAGSELTTVRGAAGAVLGTPLSLAPELFRDAAVTPASDLYALGVLLYRLVSGRYPVAAESVRELRHKHERGDSTPLIDLRPDLPVTFTDAVNRALSPAPAARFRSAGEMSQALSASIQTSTPPGEIAPPVATGRRRRRQWLGIAAAAAAVLVIGALLASQLWRAADPSEQRDAVAPAEGTPGAHETRSTHVALAVTATLYRALGGAKEALAAGALVRPGDALFMEFQSSEDAHIYVLNEDQQRNVFVLFPLAGQDVANPLAADTWHRLPGSRAGVAQNWQVTGGQGKEAFLVVAAREPLPRLEAAIANFTPASPDRRVVYTRLDPAGLLDSRGVDGVVPAGPAADDDAESVLAEIARQLAASVHDPGGLWIRQFMVYNAGR